MADLSDAVNVLVAQVAIALYPLGTGQPSSTGLPTTFYAGRPDRVELDADLAGMATGQGCIHVSVYPTAMERNVSRCNADWQSLGVSPPVVALSASGQTVTVAGTGQPFPQVASVMVNRVPYPYSIQPTDTPTTIATALAALINATVPGTTSSGAVVTLPPGALLGTVTVGGSGNAVRELGRQEQVIQITVWADTPANRDVTASTVDAALRAITNLAMPDGMAAKLTYRGSRQDDMQQKANLYKRDINYAVEYATTQVQTFQQITQVETTVSPASGGPSVINYQ